MILTSKYLLKNDNSALLTLHIIYNPLITRSLLKYTSNAVFHIRKVPFSFIQNFSYAIFYTVNSLSINANQSSTNQEKRPG